MDTLFGISPEKYWSFPTKYTDEQKKQEMKNRINSNLYIASEKRDGDYNRTVKDFDGELRMETRSISKVTGTYADKKLHVPHISETLDTLPNGTILIGELCFEDRTKTSQDVGSILRCLPEKAASRQATGAYAPLIYYIHDCWYFKGKSLMDMDYQKRIEYVKLAYETYLKKNKFIKCAEYCTSPDSIQEELEEVLEAGGEGIVMVRKDAKVEPGKRTAWKTIKIKKELDKHIDCFFTGNVKSATRSYTGKEIESWHFWEDLKTSQKLYGEYFNEFSNGRAVEPVTRSYFFDYPGSLEIGVFDANEEIIPIGYLSGIPDEMKENYKDYTMQPCEVTCMNFTNDGFLRHPRLVRLRDDIPVGDCTLDKI